MVIKLDAFVTSDQTHAELCKALKVSGFPESKLRLCIEKLDATCLGEPKITIMLKQIDKMVCIYMHMESRKFRDFVVILSMAKYLNLAIT